MADIERTVPYVPAVILKKGTCCTAPIVGPLPPDGYIPCDDLEPGCGGEGPAFELHVENPIHGDGSEEAPVGLTLDPDETNTLEIRPDGLYNAPSGGCSPGPGPYVTVFEGVWSVDTGDMPPGESPTVYLDEALQDESPDVTVRRAMTPGTIDADWMDIRDARGSAAAGVIIPSPDGGYSEVSLEFHGPGAGDSAGSVNITLVPVDGPSSGPSVIDPDNFSFDTYSSLSVTGDIRVAMNIGEYHNAGTSNLYFRITQKWFPCGDSVVDELPPPPPALLPGIFPWVPPQA